MADDLIERIRKESKGFGKLDPEFVKTQKERQQKAIIEIVRKTGRPISNEEYRSLGNIM